jgi:monoamine oxidase
MTVAIVGAGAAGLAAARHLRAHNIETIILEAGPATGGRARTTRPALLRGDWLDEGAAWLHASGRNPLVDLARAAGVPLRDAFTGRTRHLFTTADTRATEADEAAYAEAEQAWRDAVDAHPTSPDPSLAEAAGPTRGLPWAANAEHWEATIIAAADADTIGLQDWRTNELPDGDLMPAGGGLGTLLADLLTPSAGPIALNTAVTRIDRTPATHLEIHTATAGTIRADAVIVTVSTGVLGAERIRFTPPLPDATTGAIARLPMGLLSRLVLALDDAANDRLDFAPDEEGLIERQLPYSGAPAMLFGAYPRLCPHLVAFHGGRFAWSLAHDPEAANTLARAELARLYGEARVAKALARGFHATDWGTDPNFLGAYAVAGPGDFPARRTLAEPIDEARLVFAGEACRTDGLAGTVGGAIEDGRRAAELIVRRWFPPPE